MSLASYRAAPPRDILRSGWIDAFGPSRTADFDSTGPLYTSPAFKEGTLREGSGANGTRLRELPRAESGIGMGVPETIDAGVSNRMSPLIAYASISAALFSPSVFTRSSRRRFLSAFGGTTSPKRKSLRP